MKLSTLAPLAICFAVAGCAGDMMNYRKAEEPIDGDRARLRVVTNAFVKAIPDRDCIDYDAPGAGTVIAGPLAARGYRDRFIRMPLSPTKIGKNAVGEMYVVANRPITLMLWAPEEVTGPKYYCAVSSSFIPETGKDYEARMHNDYGATCSIQIVELGPVEKIIPTKRALKCN